MSDEHLARTLDRVTRRCRWGIGAVLPLLAMAIWFIDWRLAGLSIVALAYGAMQGWLATQYHDEAARRGGPIGRAASGERPSS